LIQHEAQRISWQIQRLLLGGGGGRVGGGRVPFIGGGGAAAVGGEKRSRIAFSRNRLELFGRFS